MTTRSVLASVLLAGSGCSFLTHSPMPSATATRETDCTTSPMSPTLDGIVAVGAAVVAVTLIHGASGESRMIEGPGVTTGVLFAVAGAVYAGSMLYGVESIRRCCAARARYRTPPPVPLVPRHPAHCAELRRRVQAEDDPTRRRELARTLPRECL